MKILGASIEREIPFSKEEVERILAAPGLIVNWHPWIEEISIFEEQGLRYRRSTLTGGETELVEKFWEDEEHDEFHYQAVDGLWAENRYRTKIRVESIDGGSRISWQGRLMTSEPEDEDEQMEAFFEEGLNGLEELLAEV
ncbi:SRPBCC family protein [Pelagicoccus mobilis]|uniref:SRPBCC family protein n=1 Tax=Pelagicoccus mobilis TaxID=415221 RepID=A0A934S6C1_9BACT|nr:SRPBCC family protein [Pelagicoccus mobilis]MBK1880557.1 SRPBCC family protein [Pelagicoccus mobilis]